MLTNDSNGGSNSCSNSCSSSGDHNRSHKAKRGATMEPQLEMHRFYIPSPDIKDNVIEIRDNRIVYQMNKVLRMKAGKRFSVFSELEREWLVEILEIDKRKIIGNIIEPINRDTESKLDVHLYQAIPKKTALFELVIQKATELGASHIYPLVTERTEKNRLSKFERMQTIAIEATEQSNRTKVPVIHHPVNFADEVKKQHSYVAFEYENRRSLQDYLPQIKKDRIARVFIGPEGGFDQKEIDYAISKKANLFTFGPRILRTETASVSALSIILLD